MYALSTKTKVGRRLCQDDRRSRAYRHATHAHRVTVHGYLVEHAEENDVRLQAVNFSLDASVHILQARYAELASCIIGCIHNMAGTVAPLPLTSRVRGRGKFERVCNWKTTRKWAAAVAYAMDVYLEVKATLPCLQYMLGVGVAAVLDIGSLSPADVIPSTGEIDVLLFFQSKAVLFDADVLTTVFWCYKRSVPIVLVRLTDGAAAFNFDDAQLIISNLETELERHREGMPIMIARRCGTKFNDLSELRQILQITLCTISRPVSLSQGSQVITQAEMKQVVLAMVQCAASGTASQAAAGEDWDTGDASAHTAMRTAVSF